MGGTTGEAIAVIGSACRFPGESNSPSELWRLLQSPRDLSRRVPADRFDISAYYHPDPSHHGTTDCKESYFLEGDVTAFDNGFFNLQPAETEAIDPQQRLLMETVYDSLCSAGQTIDGLQGSNTGVYVGVMCDDWSQISNRDWDLIHTYAATGTSRCIISNRISYFFDWHGPSMTIDTACSSSLVCVHQAVQALRAGESRVAIAAGANLILSPGMYIAESKLNMLSPTGKSRMWDANADGYARGEGLASIVLKPLSAALQDGDPIECVIRGTGVNQDGRTVGLTMPSNMAQADLIRATYERAGLDIDNPRDRPQFFHAHGTGTPAGDPQEAEAISRAFFGNNKSQATLHVGSIKTVIGHTEGTAGLASLIATSQSLQNAVIPPNMHFRNLSSRVAPFYSNLNVPTKPLSWPAPVTGQPRRASINSFGFGGTNAHVILESWDNQDAEPEHTAVYTVLSPLILSAASKSSLRIMLGQTRDFLREHPEVTLRDLAYTLQSRRTTLSFRHILVGRDVNEVIGQIDRDLEESGSLLATRYFNIPAAKILAIFTGQGAQWPRMGAELFGASSFASKRLDELEDALASLPPEDRPQWSLREQLLANPADSKISDAAVSQPLCTVTQILLVDLLHSAGVRWCAVVGHSSGEIAAAYAAGLISAADAVRVAFYRGLYAKLARSVSGAKGAMMAVGTSYEDALELCELDNFAGRLQVAACNSSTSITLSGDEDAVDEALEVLQDEGKFVRRLKVDTAYHSHHMQQCASSYLGALESLNLTSSEVCGPVWFSSVINGQIMTREKLTPQYWVDNMTQAVLFHDAVIHAVSGGNAPDLVQEIGPHPALRSPTLETIEEATGHSVPYTGTLRRGEHDILELARTLGFTWMNLGHGVVDFEKFVKTSSKTARPQSLAQILPKYPFDHSRSFKMLTRLSGGHANSRSPPNPLLGRRCLESETDREVHWRNFLGPKEVSWLTGHRLQGQTVFPATGYIAMAVEAMAQLCVGKLIGLIRLEDFVIDRAITFDEGQIGVETSVSLRITHSSDDELMAEFTCCSGLPFENSSKLDLNSRARVTILLEEPAPETLPSLRSMESSLADVIVEVERFYAQLTKLGYDYNGSFRSIKTIRRSKDFATGTIEDESEGSWEDQLVVHPCWLDTAIQTGFAAFCYPHDERLWTLHVPTAAASITINPYFTRLGARTQRKFGYEATIRPSSHDEVCCDIEVLAGDDLCATFVQIETLALRPFSPPAPEDDAVLFSRFEYRLGQPSGQAAIDNDEVLPPSKAAVVLTTERMGFFYLRKALQDVSQEDRASTLPHYQRFLDWAESMVNTVSSGSHPNVPQEAVHDTDESIKKVISQFANHTDVRLVQAVGENIVDEIREKGSILEHMMRDGVLDMFYEDAVGLDTANIWIGRMVAQITHRYPHLRILEIGAGTGGSTRSILPELGTAFSSYTYTDISAGFFERARERFSEYGDRMVFKIFDMEKPPADQGFDNGLYDVVLASNVLHATGDLGLMMSNVRQLIKPGGYLVVLEIITNDFLGIGTAMGGLPGWWAGAAKDERRRAGPTLTLPQWDKLLCDHGFGGIETATPNTHKLHPYSVFASQAVDGQVNALRTPLSGPTPKSPRDLHIVGGRSLATSQLADRVCPLVIHHYSRIIRLETLEQLPMQEMRQGSSVLCLTDLDEPFLEKRSASKFESLKDLWRRGRTILWVSSGSHDEHPHSAMLLGLSRAMRFEYPGLNLQMLDLDRMTSSTAQILGETLVRLELLGGRPEHGDVGTNDCLWSLEPELSIQDEQLLIPRMYPYQAGNDRYNTCRRSVRQSVRPQEQVVALEHDKGLYELMSVSPLSTALAVKLDQSSKTIRVSHSILDMLMIPDAGYFMLSAGMDQSSGECLIAFSDKSQGVLSVPARWTMPLKVSSAERALSAMATQILVQNIVAAAPAAGSIMVHEADSSIRPAISSQIEACSRTVIFSSSEESNEEQKVMFIRRNLPTRMIERLMPRDLGLFVNFGRHKFDEKILRCLSPTTHILDSSYFFNQKAVTFSHGCNEQVHRALEKALEIPQEFGDKVLQDPKVICLQDVTKQLVLPPRLTVLDWKVASVDIKLRPIDTGTIFRGNGTYMLVGLSGQLGQSLSHWMVSHGARYIVLTSRKPRVRPEFVSMIERLGAKIAVLPMDITSRTSLHSCYEQICNTMPPVIGVANGAMILEDQLFENLTWESFDRQLAPKVDGSKLLDELFYTTDLDFFVLFTSLGNIIGNSGQASYVAANQYMVSLAAQRKKRGVAGSAIAISSLLGIGYVERSAAFDSEHFARIGYRNMSEQDYLQLFAEGVLAGRPGNPDNSEIATGMSPIYDDESIQAQFRKDPKFVHFIRKRSGHQNAAGDTGIIHTLARLENAETSEEAIEVIRDSLTSRLKRILHVAQEDSINERVTLIEQGVDSIMAVEIRSWFLKELQVDMPMLKILSASATITELATEALAKIPSTLVKLKDDNSEGTESDKEPYAHETVPSDLIPTEKDAQQSGRKSGDSRLPPDTSDQKPPSIQVLTATSEDKKIFNGTKECDFTVSQSNEAVERMSFGQSRFWFLHHYVRNSKAFNIACMLRLTGTIRLDALEDAVKKIGQRHEALRTRYLWSGDGEEIPLQSVAYNASLQLEVVTAGSHDDVNREFENMRDHAWDLARETTVRICLISLSETTHYLLVGTHHISMDGFSFNVLFQDLEVLYSKRVLPPLPESAQYRAFSRHQRDQYSKGEMQQALDFYRGIIPPDLAPIKLLPFAKVQTRPLLDRYSTVEARVSLQPSLVMDLKTISSRYRSTSFHLYVAALQALVFRLLPDVENFFIGIADANRLDKDYMGSIGMFFNLLPIRCDRVGNGTTKFGETIQAMRTKVYTALEHSKVPLDVLVNDLGVQRSACAAPIFQILVDYRLMIRERGTYLGCELDGERWHTARIGYDMGLEIVEGATGQTDIVLRMQDALYSQESTDLLMRSFVNLLEEASRSPDIATSDLPTWAQCDIEKAIDVGRGTDMDYEWPSTICHRIDDMIKLHSNAIAMRDGYGCVLDYTSMGRRVGVFAHALLQTGIEEGMRVGVLQCASADWICSLLAILRVGAVYVPLDPTTSTSRLKSIAVAAHLSVILTDRIMIAQSPFISGGVSHILNVSDLDCAAERSEINVARPSSAAIVLYTSGSTGEPKGIIMSHETLCAHFEGFHHAFDIASMARVVLQQSTFSFDYSLHQIFAALAGGGCLYVAPSEVRGDPEELAKIMITEGVTYTAATPTEYDMWFRFALENLRQVKTWQAAWFGGEATSEAVINGFRDLHLPGLRIFSGYGPAEVTVSSTKAEVLYHDKNLQFPLPGGYMLPNYSAYVVDEAFKPVPLGVPGEILIGGVGPAIGYLNQAESTSQKFLPNEFLERNDHYLLRGWDRVYRSGDRGRLREDGAIYCDGRIDGDTQVKLRGFRVELGEIETVIIREAPDIITNAVVILRDNVLVAYVTFAANSTDGMQQTIMNELRSGLHLPSYMRPALFVKIDRFPLTDHYKIDRRAIQGMTLPDSIHGMEHKEGQLTPTQRALADLWQQTLPVTILGLHQDSDFFLSGGNSILLVKVQSMIRSTFGSKVRLSDLMNSSTVAGMSSVIEAADQKAIDWDGETFLDDSIISTARSAAVLQPHRIGRTRILLTGATGYLGHRLLLRLVRDIDVSSIVCVVRDQEISGHSLVSIDPKISLIQGDLSLPRLGLSKEDFERISLGVDSILHCAADRNFWDSYTSLRPVNVYGVKTLSRMAIFNKAQFHFMSSGAVGAFAGESGRKPPTDGSEGYISSKWAAEQYLRKVSKAFGIPVSIHRPEMIRDNQANTPQFIEYLAQESVHYATKIGSRPDFSSVRGTIYMAPVEDVANDIAALVLRTSGNESRVPGEVNILPHSATGIVDLEDLATQVDARADLANFQVLPTLPVLKWFGEAKKAGFGQLIMAQNLVMGDGTQRLVSRR